MEPFETVSSQNSRRTFAKASEKVGSAFAYQAVARTRTRLWRAYAAKIGLTRL